MVHVAIADMRHAARVRPMVSTAGAVAVSVKTGRDVTVIVVVAVGVAAVVPATLENTSGPLLSPTDTLSDSSLGHIDVHPTRVFHQEQHRTVAREQDQDEEVEAAVPDYQRVSRQHH